MVGEEGIEPVRALPRWSYSPLPHLEASLPYFGRTYGFRTRFSALKGRRPSPRSPMSQFWWCQIDSNYLFGLMRPKSAPCGVTNSGGRYVNRTHYFAVLWSCSPSPYHPGHRPICLTPLILLLQALAVTPHAVSVC